jgi:DNA-binding response OmpR family regulator
MHFKTLCKLLLIEDDLPLASLICQYLRKNFCDVVHIATGAELELLMDIGQFQIVLCDVMLPDINGFSLITEIKKKTACPILFLTALDENEDQIKGLELGAVDYIVKPIEPAVLLARIKVQLRNSNQPIEQNIITLNNLVLDNRLKQVFYCGEHISLTVQEFEVLFILAKNHLKLIPRDELFKQIVGREYDGLDRAVDLVVSRLRKKLTQSKLSFISIRAIRGKGYIFNSEPTMGNK